MHCEGDGARFPSLKRIQKRRVVWGKQAMSLRRILKSVVPGPIRRLGWRGYFHARDNWLGAIVGCRTTEKTVALTFDDGPNPDCTPLILGILAHYQVKTTFFMLGRNVAAYPEIARDVVQAGHAIGNHTYTHRCLADSRMVGVIRALSQCRRTIREVTQVAPRVMRPPFGAQDPRSFLIARIMGYAVVAWSASGDDWQGDPASAITERVLASIQPGGIILLHDGWEPPAHQPEWRPEYALFQDRSPTVEALGRISVCDRAGDDP
jgi:peptidoglycan/xylan/chitin deacetylase (PgdA/CDA1 family)